MFLWKKLFKHSFLLFSLMEELVLSGCLVINPAGEIYLLFRKKHKHYETPGGKVDPGEELKETALRELFEEVSGIRKEDIKSIEYFTSVRFIIPDGRRAIAHKFIIRLNKNLNLKPNEEIFDEKKSRFIPMDEFLKLGDQLSPDLKILVRNYYHGINQII